MSSIVSQISFVIVLCSFWLIKVHTLHLFYISSVFVTSARILAPLGYRSRQLVKFCREQALLRWQCDAPREHTLEKNGCGSQRFRGKAVLWAFGVKGHPFLFPFSLPKLCWGRSFPVPAQCTSGITCLIHILNLHLGCVFYYANGEEVNCRTALLTNGQVSL